MRSSCWLLDACVCAHVGLVPTDPREVVACKGHSSTVLRGALLVVNIVQHVAVEVVGGLGVPHDPPSSPLREPLPTLRCARMRAFHQERALRTRVLQSIEYYTGSRGSTSTKREVVYISRTVAPAFVMTMTIPRGYRSNQEPLLLYMENNYDYSRST